MCLVLVFVGKWFLVVFCCVVCLGVGCLGRCGSCVEDGFGV